MRIPDLVLEKLRELPPDKQRAVLEFVESLQQNGASAKPLKGFEGLLENYNVQITGRTSRKRAGKCGEISLET